MFNVPEPVGLPADLAWLHGHAVRQRRGWKGSGISFRDYVRDEPDFNRPRFRAVFRDFLILVEDVQSQLEQDELEEIRNKGKDRPDEAD